jgi:two-component system KDP operon response regulator KdpE
MDGMELLQRLRTRSAMPVIFLTSKDEEVDELMGLRLGADDYITKPFSIQELLARVRAQLRRVARQEPSADKVDEGDFSIDQEAHRVLVRGQEIHLTPKEFDLLLHFARNARRVLTHKTLLRAVWGPAGADQPEYLRVLVAQLRKKIETAESKYIESEPWVGYRFNPEG